MTSHLETATRLSVILRTDARWWNHSLSDEIVERALRAGLAGATRFGGSIEGFGSSGHIHTDIDPDILSNLPCEVVIVDPSEQKVRDFIPQMREILDHGIAVIDTVQVMRIDQSTRTTLSE